MRSRLLLRMTCAIAAMALIGQTTAFTQAGPLAGFEASVERAVRDWGTPGLAIAIVKDGNVVFSRGYGVRAVGRPEPVDSHTLFAIGSTTKAMTAALVGMLVEDGKLAWDDPVIKHLPWFQTADPYLTREITIRDLLTHRAGFPNADYLWYGQDRPAREILGRLRLLGPSYSPRSSFIYQNVMYAAAGAVIEAAGGQSWEQMLRTRIFEPLGMSDSIATAATLSTKANVAQPHHLAGGVLTVIDNRSVDNVAPAGSVWSSVHDMSKWMRMLLDGGKSGDRVLLKPTTVDEIFTPHAIVTRAAFYPTAQITKPRWMTYGLGWFQQDYRGRAIDFHTGSIDGMVAISGLLRDERLGVFVLANRDHSELRHALMFDVFDRFLGGGQRDWSAELHALYAARDAQAAAQQKLMDTRRVQGTSPSLPLARYAGTYADPLRGEIQVTFDGERLRLAYGEAYVGVLDHWHFDTFRATWRAEWRGRPLMSFSLNPNGEPQWLQAFGARFTRRPS